MVLAMSAVSQSSQRSLRLRPNNHDYSAVQLNVVKGCVNAVLIHATFEHVYLDSRVLPAAVMVFSVVVFLGFVGRIFSAAHYYYDARRG